MSLKSVRQACLRAYLCLIHGPSLFWAMCWVRVLNGYAENPVSKEDRLFALDNFLYRRKKCRMDGPKFREVTQKWGYDLNHILRTVTNHWSPKPRSLR
jgi:hypothetical protein